MIDELRYFRSRRMFLLQHGEALFTVLWTLTKSDFWTFAIPNTVFGLCMSSSDRFLAQETLKLAPAAIPLSFVRTVLWNWTNLALFDLANQRLPDSVTEDTINKPDRPIPLGLISAHAARRALLFGIPSAVAASYFFLGAWIETLIIICLTWMYNDLRGGDDDFILRNAIISTAYGVYNYGSVRVAGDLQGPLVLNTLGQTWICVISLVIFSTMHIQDLKDVAGDKSRGRRSAILVLGDKVARWTLALSIMFWSFACPWAIGLHPSIASPSCLASVSLGLYVSCRILWLKGKKEDATSWRIWAAWLVILYASPLEPQASVIIH